MHAPLGRETKLIEDGFDLKSTFAKPEDYIEHCNKVVQENLVETVAAEVPGPQQPDGYTCPPSLDSESKHCHVLGYSCLADGRALTHPCIHTTLHRKSECWNV